MEVMCCGGETRSQRNRRRGIDLVLWMDDPCNPPEGFYDLHFEGIYNL